MYLAPLNYDRYFKKVFSDTRIAKRFLEDFFDTQIESIELLTQYHKITDDATAVEFDFRCKIHGRYIIIDMQQWFKPDIVKRFYTYHCLNTALQLEKMPLKSIYLERDRKKDIKDYNELMPVITLIWMVDDVLGFGDDFIGYNMTPEIVSRFLQDHLLWESGNLTTILAQRKSALAQLDNKTKQLDFLQENRLIFAFQKNIVKNQKFAKYRSWFQLAEKTKDKANKKAQFLQYAEDEIFVELMRRISKETLTSEDFTYIENYEEFMERVRRYDKGVKEEGRAEEKIAIAKEMKKDGMPFEKISRFTALSTPEIEAL